MVEYRKIQRRHIMFYSRVFDLKSGRLLGYLENITSEGAMIISEQPLRTNEVYSLRMTLPEEMFPKPVLNLEARSIWCEIDVDPQFFNTGFKFSDLPKEDIVMIEQIVEDYGFRDLKESF